MTKETFLFCVGFKGSTFQTDLKQNLLAQHLWTKKSSKIRFSSKTQVFVDLALPARCVCVCLCQVWIWSCSPWSMAWISQRSWRSSWCGKPRKLVEHVSIVRLFVGKIGPGNSKKFEFFWMWPFFWMEKSLNKKNLFFVMSLVFFLTHGFSMVYFLDCFQGGLKTVAPFKVNMWEHAILLLNKWRHAPHGTHRQWLRWNGFAPSFGRLIWSSPLCPFAQWMLLDQPSSWLRERLLSFLRTGYTVGPDVIMSPKKVAMHYLTTWFAVDFAIAGDLDRQPFRWFPYFRCFLKRRFTTFITIIVFSCFLQRSGIRRSLWQSLMF